MTKRKLHVGTSPLTGSIYAGALLKDGRTWASGKQDVTIESLVSVAEHALLFEAMHGGPIIVSKADGTPEFEITVKRL